MEGSAASGGLTSAEAKQRLARYGPNRVAEEPPHPLRRLLGKLWAPVPWMLEAACALELALGHFRQAAIIGTLLVANAVLGFVEEGRARDALQLLERRLRIEARVRRDGAWQRLPAEELVPGDAVHLRAGDLVPADLRLFEGAVSLDQSMLTGESVAIEVERGESAPSGSVVARGEASGVVTATGAATVFGKTAELVKSARAESHLERVVFRIVRAMAVVDAAIVVVLLATSLARHVPLAEMLPFSLILLVASVPVALPATFTVAAALGAREMARRGVLVTRLSALEDAAAMDVLCSDKTGTLTQNRLSLAAVRPLPPATREELLRLAAAASDEATQDPLDLEVLGGARAAGVEPPERLAFVPFDPATKRSEATIREGGRAVRVSKGAPHVLAAWCGTRDPAFDVALSALGEAGQRVLAVATEVDGRRTLAGLLGFSDPPREDAAATISELAALGVRTMMVTGDSPETARAVARQVGISGSIRSAAALTRESTGELAQAGGFAGVLPEHKFHLVRLLERAGHVTGMTGDGVNDAPALRQAQVGVAVSSATDIAKAAASIVLTRPGLSGMREAIDVGRRVYQRMLSYTLNKIVKTFHVAIFLGLGFLLFGVFVTTSRHVLLLMLASDFVTMSLASDRVRPATVPERWNVRAMAASALVLSGAWCLFSFAVFAAAQKWLQLPLPSLQTLAFLVLVFSGQATVYLVRARHRVFGSPPGRTLVASSLFAVAFGAALAMKGWLVAPLPWPLVGALFAAVVVFALVLDGVKLRLFRRTGLIRAAPRRAEKRAARSVLPRPRTGRGLPA